MFSDVPVLPLKPSATIRRLPSALVNRIAAGEVVERPAAVVKELVENALDAGATRLSVEASQGGRWLRLADNGKGIPAEELPLAFENHATSKLPEETMLDAIGTLGFRGEALASISSIAKVTCQSRTATVQTGTQLVIEGGSTPVLSPVGCGVGTIMQVQDLFFNTPARLKFLKRPATELAAIEETLQGLALSRPDVRFTVTLNEKLAFETKGSGSYSNTVCEVLKLDDALKSALTPLDFSDEPAGFSLQGVLADPTQSALQWRSKPKAWWFLLNGRLIRCPVLSKAVEAAFEGVLEERSYPLAVLALTLPLQSVDVNVHPTKREVRYAQPNQVFSFLRHGVRSTLERYFSERMALKAPQGAPGFLSKDSSLVAVTEALNPSSGLSSGFVDAQQQAQHFPGFLALKERLPSQSTDGQPTYGAYTQGYHPAPRPSQQAVQQSLGMLAPLGLQQKEAPSAETSTETLYTNPEHSNLGYTNLQTPSLPTAGSAASSSFQEPLPPEGWRVIGQLFNTYVLLETLQGLMIVDQHIASERYCYERLKQQVNEESSASQALLVAEPLGLSPLQAEVLAQHQSTLERLGFAFELSEQNSEDQAPTAEWQLTAVPLLYPERKQLSSKQQLTHLLEQLETAGEAAASPNVENLIATLACHSAVRAGELLSEAHMKKLVEDWLGCRLPWSCPHGRPIAHTLNASTLNQFFHRPSLPVNATSHLQPLPF